MPVTSNISWPDKAMVGYVDTTATGSMSAITSGQAQAYSVLVFGFTEEDGTISADMASEVSDFRSQKGVSSQLNLVSAGGAGGDLDLTDATVANLLQTIKDNDFDGIDLDLEVASIDITVLSAFVDKLRTAMGTDYLLTVAPILAGTAEAPTLNIPNGGPSLAPIYKDAVFDAILVQAYNSGEGFTYPLPSNPATLVGENSPDIISAAYNSLQEGGTINTATKIVMGIPTNAGGAPTASNLWDTSDYTTIPPVISTNLKDIVGGNYSINPTQFGGLMAWSLNTDAMPSAYPPYTGFENAPVGYFADNVAPLLNTLETVPAE